MRDVRVECHAGYRGSEAPRRFELQGRTIEVAEVVARWREPDALCFRVLGGGGRVYVLRRDARTGAWGLPEVGG